jgi:uncharacterized protein (TIGR02996 family)
LDPLLSRIFDDPDSDEARAVYADALAERGDPRGELIQLQLQLGKLTPRTDAWGACVAASDRLMWKHRGAWLTDDDSMLLLRRGFVERVRLARASTIARLAGEPLRAIHLIDAIPFEALPRTTIELTGTVPPELLRRALPGLEHVSLARSSLPILQQVPARKLRTLVARIDQFPDAGELDLLRAAPSLELSIGGAVDAAELLRELPNVIGLSAMLDQDLPTLARPLDWLDLVVDTTVRRIPSARRVWLRYPGVELVEAAATPVLEELTIAHAEPQVLPGIARLQFPSLRSLRIIGGAQAGWSDQLVPLARRLHTLDVRRLAGGGELGELCDAGLAELHVPTISSEEAQRLVGQPPPLGRVRHEMSATDAARILDERWPPLGSWLDH